MSEFKSSSTWISVLVLLVLSQSLHSAEYYCRATRKIDSDRVYSEEQLEKWQFATRIEEFGETAFLSRCSYSVIEGGKVTCDRYPVDRIQNDENAKIKKYYLFNSQADFQIFSDLSSVENNGRASIQFGKCEIISP